MARWAMVIDLSKCIGCGSCIEICKQVNNVPPESEWRRLVERTFKKNNNLKRMFLTMGCMHCDNPPCLDVCPTKATYQTREGIVNIDQERCIGCAACVLACPYKARSINHCARAGCYETNDNFEVGMGNEDQIGICSKCNFCLPLINTGLKNGLQPGKDPDATPMCVRHCLGGALSFGDLDDPGSHVNSILSRNKTTRILEELGTNPAVYYISDIED